MNHEYPEIEAAYLRLAESAAAMAEVWREEERLRAALAEAEAREVEIREQSVEARRALVRAVMAADPKPLPEAIDWYYPVDATWQVRSGGRVFALIPASENGVPRHEEEAWDAFGLAIIDI